jgi:hypothetical protein
MNGSEMGRNTEIAKFAVMMLLVKMLCIIRRARDVVLMMKSMDFPLNRRNKQGQKKKYRIQLTDNHFRILYANLINSFNFNF